MEPRTDGALMSFDEAAKLDPDRQPGEVDAGKWVPVTRNTWSHCELAGNVYALLREYAKHHPGWSISINDHVRVLKPSDTIDGAELLPDFRCRVAELFEIMP